MSHFSDQVYITIGGFTQNIIYYDLKLSQKMADHHHFSFVWQYTGKAVINPVDQAKAIRSYNGNEVIFTFKSLTGIKLMSKGIINKLTSVDLNGSAVNLHVSGISHTIVLDDRPKSRTYLERGMDDIVLDILSEGPTEFYQREAIRSTYMKEFNYMAQYNESNFNFLKRLASRYGQWFYFDGMRMQFGQTKASKIKLINGASMHNFKIEVNMTAQRISLGGYDYNNEVNIRNASERTSVGSQDGFASNVGYNQGTVTQPEFSLGTYTNNAQNKEEIVEMVELQTAGNDANSVYYSGISYFPLGLGQTFTVINQTVEHNLVCIEAIHHSEVHGNYTCEFKAIPADVAAPNYTDVHVFAKAETQPAKIKDNNDPKGLGRVRVEFFWGAGSKSSQWIRMIQPHSGLGKGFYFIPEIGEEVLVGFEGSNAQNPYVMGAHYNGQKSSGYYTPKNDIKAIHTRSGIKIIMNDADGSVLIEDPSSNKYFMDGKGSITCDAPKNITLNAGENININAGQNMNTNVGLNKTDNIGVNHSESVGGLKSLGVTGDFNAIINGKYSEHIKGNFESTTEKDRHDNSKQGLNHYTEGDLNKNAQKEIQNNSGEQTRQN
ncbi:MULTISPECIES: type VI secretion system Vgr family protein [Flavobacterium]|uniref:type VI secretion system Vgr family protein n=1 Tax=Flavobacterium TaxID=237 RepID=UPI0021141146|nr:MULTISPECIES: phage baseplate assembly protein V [Flavobacterium]UUF14170.1 phage baseplate assembly protein V [Flavobacterium panici]